ncbi:MAG: aminopeptidase P family protein [Bacteroidota bacterium]
MFPSTTYQNRRAALAQRVGNGLILLPGNNEAPMNYRDNIYPFRQDSNFRYFAGLNKPNLVVAIDASTGETTLYGTDITMDHIVWMGEQPSVRELADSVGIEHTAAPAELATLLTKTTQTVHYLPPYREERFRRLQDWLGKDRDFIEANASEAAIRAVVAIRSIKTSEEIVEMEKAVQTSRAMHHAAMDLAKPGMTEAEIAGVIEGIAISAGGRLSYPAIVTVNGQILHNHYHGNILKEGDLLLIDAGAESDSGYAGDITRTFCIGRAMDAQQQAIYDIVKRAEEDVIADLKPGVPYRDYHQQAVLIIATGLTELGIMKGDPQAAVTAGAHTLFFPHGLGHMIGMDVHDMEDLGEDRVGYTKEIVRSPEFGTRALRLGRTLEAGFVITVEPGIYFIPALIDQWQAEDKCTDFINYAALAQYRDFGGIRIEDNVLITENGCRVLGDGIRK